MHLCAQFAERCDSFPPSFRGAQRMIYPSHRSRWWWRGRISHRPAQHVDRFFDVLFRSDFVAYSIFHVGNLPVVRSLGKIYQPWYDGGMADNEMPDMLTHEEMSTFLAEWDLRNAACTTRLMRKDALREAVHQWIWWSQNNRLAQYGVAARIGDLQTG